MLLDDLAAHVVLDRLRHSVLVALQCTELLGNRLSNAGFHDQLQQGHIVEG